MFEPFPFVLETHYGDDHPEWGSGPKGPLIRCDMAHAGELLDAVIGDDVEKGGKRVYWVIRCELCIAIHVWPLPSPTALKRFYSEQFYQNEKPDYIERYEKDRRWWELCVHSPLVRQAVAALQAEPQVLRVVSFGDVGMVGSESAHSFLEVGAGPGIALDVAQSLSMATYAIEPSQLCARRLQRRKHTVWQGTFEDFQGSFHCAFHAQQFDIVYLYEVLEHQPCPEDFLLRCYDLLAPGGVLVVVVPNEWSALQKRAVAELGLSRWWVSVPDHLFYWTKKTLQLQIRRCGFEIVDFRSSYPIEQALFNGDIYIGNDVIGRKVHQRRMDMELKAVADGRWGEVEEEYRSNLHEKNIGRELICIARKRK